MLWTLSRSLSRVRHRSQWALGAGLVLILWLAACSGPPPSVAPLRPLHLQHVTRITVLDGVVGRSPMRRVDGLTTYVPAPTEGSASTSTSSDLHLLGTIGSTVYDVDLDRDSFFTVAVDDACNAYLSVTVDGRWAACGTEAGTQTFTIGMPQPAHQGLLLEDMGTQSEYGSLAWGPGSYSLAVVVSHADNTRSINIYQVSYGPQLVATLTFPGLLVDQVSWSPDGQWLALEASLPNGSGGFSLRLLHVGPLLPNLAPSEGTLVQPPTIVVTASMLETLQGGEASWGPQVGAITFSGSSGKIIERNLATGSERTILTQNSGNLCGLAWAPDGHRLIFQICGPAGGDYAGPPAQLYVYDATSAS